MTNPKTPKPSKEAPTLRTGAACEATSPVNHHPQASHTTQASGNGEPAHSFPGAFFVSFLCRHKEMKEKKR
jgi:hypothetical protein